MNTWTIVCNNSIANIFKGTGLTTSLELIMEMENKHARKKEQDYQADRPGRVSGRTGSARHVLQSPTSDKDIHMQKFCQDIAQELNKNFQAGKFERLILVASPKLLGMLREEIQDPCKKSIVDSLAEDLTNLDITALNNVLKEKIHL